MSKFFKTLTAAMLCVAMAPFVSCKKNETEPEQPNNETTVEIVPVNVNISEELNIPNLQLETFYGMCGFNGNTATIDLTNVDLPQIIAVTDTAANIYMLYRGRVSENTPVVMDANSTALAIISLHPMLGPITETSEYNQLLGMIQGNSHYEEFLQGVTAAIAAGRPLNDTTNLSVMTPLYNLYEELCDTTGMGMREDITDYCESYPIMVTTEGKKAIMRATGLCPSYYGKAYMSSGGTKDIVVRSRADYGGMDMFTHTVGDMHLGEPTTATFSGSNGDIEFCLSRTNAQAKADFYLHLANQILGMVGAGVDNAAVNVIADGIASAISNAQAGSDVLTPSLIAGCVYTGFVAYLQSEANTGFMANWQLAGGLISRLSLIYNLVKNPCNAMWRMAYYMNAPEEINFCLEYRSNTGVIPCAESTLIKTGGDGQSGGEGETLPQPLEVYVSTKTHNDWYIHPNLTVRFSVEEGGGSLRYTDVTVDSDQKAKTWWTLGDGETQKISAVVVDPATDEEFSNTVYFTANAGDFVDLGLPSGLLWATRNVGADSPEDYGDYFAWGEVTPKSTYSWENYRWWNWTNNLIIYKYNTYPNYYGPVDNKTVLELADDAANVIWGECRMPTKTEMEELKNNCTWTWTTQNGKNGRRVTGPNGNSIFLPAAGYYYGSSLYYAGSYGSYWSSSLCIDDPRGAYTLRFGSGYVGMSYDYRYYGQSVRPVRPSQK